MAKYTYEDIIIDPKSEEAKNAVGKEVYFADTPASCLNAAKNNNKAYLGYLKRLILGDEEEPFYVNECVVSAPSSWTCIIVKKEEPKPKYMPFESAQEFLDEYYNSETGRVKEGLEHYLSTRGLWLKCDDHYELVTYIYDNGITIDGISINWKTLFDSYTFIDGSPCGKLAEEE